MMEEKQRSSEQEWTTDFHGVNYIVTLTSSDVMLTLEVENADTNERWSADYTAQHIEEMTHKAGSLKKFAVYTKMLASAFSKESAEITVDVLTFSDLELLRAQMGGTKPQPKMSLSVSSSSIKQYQKRYVILTYTSQFDKCHYPLPLIFEDTPNFPALKRTIARLRRQLADSDNAEKEPSSEKEKELRQQMSQLRQDNTELRHRLRHGGNAMNTSVVSPNSSANQANAEVVAMNVKLRKQVDALKKELTDSSLAYERLRTESAREIAKWKLKIGASGNSSAGPSSPFAGSPSGYVSGGGSTGGTSAGKGDAAAVIAQLQKKLDLVVKELRFERLSKSQNRSWNNQTSNISPARGSSGSWNNTTRSNTYGRSNSADRNTVSVKFGNRGWTTASDMARSRTTGIAGRSVSPIVPRTTSATTGGYRSRESTPPLRSRPNSAPHSASSPRSSPAASSSLGGRFDPTAFQRERAQREQANRAGRSWNAGATSSPTTGSRHRYQSPSRGESGYASANSQSSAGSRRSDRSQRSQHSDASSRASSANSKDSRTKKKSSKKKGSKKGSDGTATSRHQDAPEPARARPSYSKSGTSEVSSHLLMGSGRDGRGEVPAEKTSSRAAPAAAETTKRTIRAPQGSREVAEPAASAYSTRESKAARPVEHRQHRRSRESPDGDSETDDSEFLPSSNNKSSSNAQRARAAAAAKPVAASPGVTTQYNTYLNAGPGLRKSVENESEMRRSHEKLVALAQERSTNLIRGEDVQSESDSELRRSQKLRASLDRDDANVWPTDLSARSSFPPPQQKVELNGTPSRQSMAASQRNAEAPSARPAPANPLRNSSERPLSAHLAAPAPSAAAPVIGNQVRRSLRRPSDGSTQSALTSSTAGLPSGAAYGASAAAATGGTSSVRSSGSSLNTNSMMAGPNSDIADIDKRILALQSYLENARTGILASDKP